MKHENQFFFFLTDIESADSYLQSNKGLPFYLSQLKTVEHKAIIRTVYKSVMNDENCTEDQKDRVWKLLQNLKNLLVQIQSEGDSNNRKRPAESGISFKSPKKHIVSNNQASTSQSINAHSNKFSKNNLLPSFPISPIMRPKPRPLLSYPHNLAAKNSSYKFTSPRHSTPNKHD